MYNDHFSHRRTPPLAKFLFFLAMAAFFLFVLGQVIMFLWNGILVDATGVKPLGFWQSLGLLALSRILVGGMRFGASRGPWSRSSRHNWKEKWMQMSEEERADFKARWRERCEKK